jgi:hypothetical protein
MPNRILRDAILSSERVAKLGWPAEVFYRRLMSIVDDYGRMEANPQLLRSRCYPLQTDAVRVTDITRWLAACHDAGLILNYAVSGKQYLELVNFGQQQRSASKFPQPPPVDINCSQPLANEHLGVVVDVVVSEVVGGIASGDKSPSAGEPPKNGNCIAYIPLNDGSEWGVDSEYASELERLYPAVDMPQTLNEIRAWNISNPKKRKTAGGIKRHINSWFAGEQNGG